MRLDRHTLTRFLAGAALLITANAPAIAGDDTRVWRSEITPVPFFVVDVANNLIEPGMTDALAPLYDRRSFQSQVDNGMPPVPVTAPDGHHITWGEFSSVDGRIWVVCNNEGTRFVMLLTNLIPHGVYTIWNVTFTEPGFTGQFSADGTTANLAGVGPVGPPDGSKSVFRASATGSARVSVTTPPGELGLVGEIATCAPRDEVEWHLVGLYHYDDRPHGSSLGPPGTMAEQFAFVFK